MQLRCVRHSDCGRSMKLQHVLHSVYRLQNVIVAVELKPQNENMAHVGVRHNAQIELEHVPFVTGSAARAAIHFHSRPKYKCSACRYPTLGPKWSCGARGYPPLAPKWKHIMCRL